MRLGELIDYHLHLIDVISLINFVSYFVVRF